MQMIQMARETNCHQVNATSNNTITGTSDNNNINNSINYTNTSNNCDQHRHNNLISSTLFTQTAASKMGLLSISLDTKGNCNRDSSVISPSCQPVSCMNHGHDTRHNSSTQQTSSPSPALQSTQQQQQQQQRQQCTLQQQQQQSASLNHVKQLPKIQQQESIQGKQRRQFDDHNVIIKSTMSTSSCTSSKSCNKPQQLMCKQPNFSITGNNIPTGIISTHDEQQQQQQQANQVVFNNSQPSNMTDILIKSSANSGYCSSFGSSSTSFFDDEEGTSQTCDHNVSSQCDDDDDDENENVNDSSGHDDNNIDADGLVDHVVADAGDDEVDGVVESNCKNNASKSRETTTSTTMLPCSSSSSSVSCNENARTIATASSQAVSNQLDDINNTSVGKCNTTAMHMNRVTCNLSNATIDDSELSTSCRQSNSSSPSNCTNNTNNLLSVTGDDDDSHAYPIQIECGCNELTLMIEENLTAAYLINILLLRFSLQEDISWTLFMKIKCSTFNQSSLSLECMIEDFEEVVPLVLKYQSFTREIKLILRRESNKLIMYNNLPNFFDLNMIDLGEYGRVRSSSISFTNVSTHSNRSNSFDGSNSSIRKPVTTNVSSNEYQALQRFLLISDTFDLVVTSPVKLIRSCTSTTIESHSAILENTQLTLSHVNSMCKDVIDFRSNRYDLFTCCTDNDDNNDTNISTPTGEYYFYLVSPNELCPMYKIISSNESTNLCWISCLRLAKIGMQNMRRYIKSYKTSLNSSSCSLTLQQHTQQQQQQQQQAQAQQQQQQQTVQSHLRHGSFGSKSCNVSLIASSPPTINSYNAIAIANVSPSTGCSSTFSRQNNIHNQHHSLTYSSSLVSPSSSSSSSVSASTAASSSSSTLSANTSLGPWFYENLSREQASKLLSQYLSINGVFLVRQSTRSPGTFVLSLVLNRKILHIIVMSVQIDAHTCYLTLDQGKTKFADLSQLIQFYQLNHSLLGCKLTHYVSRG